MQPEEITDAPAELASQAALGRLFSPDSVAVVGASETGLGAMVFDNLRRDFPGNVYPVNPRRTVISGVPTYPTVDDLPEPVDMVVLLVPAAHVPRIIERSAERGIGGAVVLASGFAEVGPEGQLAQARLTAVAEEHNFPIVGPNCNGFMNGHRKVTATFAIPPESSRPPAGSIAVVSQSGGFGSYILLKAIAGGLDVGWYVSTGNEADINVARSLRYLIERPEVEVVLTFFEAVRSPEVFLATAARAAELGKPIVAVKAGYTAEGSRATLSHTASIAGSGEVYDAICEQYGLIRAASVEEMVDFGLALQARRQMAGRRLGVMTMSGGAGALMADAAELAGLTVPPLPATDQQHLRSLMHRFASPANPVDLSGIFDPASFGPVLSGLINSSGLDAAVSLIWNVGEREADLIKKVYSDTDKPMAVAVTLPTPLLADSGIPTYTDPARAVRALGAVARYAASQQRQEQQPTFEPRGDRVEKVRQLLAEEAAQPFVLESVAKQILADYGIPVSREVVAQSADAAVAAAAEMGGPVALKVLSYSLPHKSDAGALRLGLRDETAVRDAYDEMVATIHTTHPDLKFEGVLVQEMVPASVEISCGLQRDPIFGPMIVVGVGGTLIEIVGGSVLLRAPFSRRMAQEAVGRIAGGRLRTGKRGISEAQASMIVDVMTGLSALALEIPEVESIDINPIRVHGDGIRAVDALLVLTPAAVPATPLSHPGL